MSIASTKRFLKGTLLFFSFKIKVSGTGVCLEYFTIPMYNEGNKTKPFELYQNNSLLAKHASHGLNLPEVHDAGSGTDADGPQHCC